MHRQSHEPRQQQLCVCADSLKIVDLHNDNKINNSRLKCLTRFLWSARPTNAFFFLSEAQYSHFELRSLIPLLKCAAQTKPIAAVPSSPAWLTRLVLLLSWFKGSSSLSLTHPSPPDKPPRSLLMSERRKFLAADTKAQSKARQRQTSSDDYESSDDEATSKSSSHKPARKGKGTATGGAAAAAAVGAGKKRTKTKLITEKDALSYVTSMRLSLTGARAGDIILGKHNINQDALFQVVGNDIRPCHKDLDALRTFPEVWAKFLQTLQRFPFFAAMTVDERARWLTQHQSLPGSPDHYIGDEATQLLLIQPGKPSKSKKEGTSKTPGLCDLEPDVLNLLATEATTPGDIERLCSPNHTTKAAHPVLIFIKRLWRLDEAPPMTNAVTFRGPAIDVQNGTWCGEWKGGADDDTMIVDTTTAAAAATFTPSPSSAWHLVQFGDVEVALVVPKSMQRLDLSDSQIPVLLREAGIGVGMEVSVFEVMVQRCIDAHVGITSSGFKSLIQKPIRFQPHTVLLNKHDDPDTDAIPAQVELGVAFLLGTRNKGSFVPDIQRFVSGLEASTKRLAVTSLEDAAPALDTTLLAAAAAASTNVIRSSGTLNSDSGRTLVSLLAAAKLAQSNHTWFPTRDMVVRWLRFSINVMQSPYAWAWNIPRGKTLKPFTVQSASESQPLQLCSALLDNLRSFAGDLHMTRDIAAKSCHLPMVARMDKHTGSIFDYLTASQDQRRIMPLCHFVDFHCTTDWVFHLLPRLVELLGSDTKPRPFAPIFDQTWKQSSCQNERRPGRYAVDEHLAQAIQTLALVAEEQQQQPIIYRGVEGYSYSSGMDESSLFMKALREAQWLYLQTKRQKVQITRPLIDAANMAAASAAAAPASNNYKLQWKFDVVWPSAMMGSMEVRVQQKEATKNEAGKVIDPAGLKTILVSLKSSNPYELRAMRKPVRGLKSKGLQPQVIQDAIAMARERLLREGVPMNACRAPIPAFASRTLFLIVNPVDGSESYWFLNSRDATMHRKRMMAPKAAAGKKRRPAASSKKPTKKKQASSSSSSESEESDSEVDEKHDNKTTAAAAAAAATPTTKQRRRTAPKTAVDAQSVAPMEDVSEAPAVAAATAVAAASSSQVQASSLGFATAGGNELPSVRWEDIQTVDIEYGTHEPIEMTAWNAIGTTGLGVVRDFDRRFEELLAATPLWHLSRCMTFLNGCGSEIHMNRLSREGRGLKQAVSIGDVGAYHFLTQLSLLAPAALRLVAGQTASPGVFRVGSGPLLWMMRDRIRQAVRKQQSTEGQGAEAPAPGEGWDRYNWTDSKKRDPRPYQIKCVEELIVAHELGRTVHYLWEALGSGKTFMSLLFMKYLAQSGQLPKYLLLSTTKSAIAHLVQEVQALGLEVHPLIPIKGSKKKAAAFASASASAAAATVQAARKQNRNRGEGQEGDNSSSDEESDQGEEEGGDDSEQAGRPEPDVKRMKPYCINIVEHDHMRLCKAQIVELGPQLAFNLDEADDCTNDSLRTSAALDIAKNAVLSLLMTGTLPVDAGLAKLTQWLSLCNNCTVTPRNAYAMATSLISNEADIKVRVERPPIIGGCDAVFAALPGSRERYRALAPVRFGGTNKAPDNRTFRELCQLCWDAGDHWNVAHMLANDPTQPSVFLTRGDAHSQQLRALLLQRIPNLRPEEIYVLRGDNSTFVTPDTVRAGGPLYRCFLFPVQNSRGFELTAYARMYKGVFFCSQADDEQAEGRMVRMTQEHESVEFLTPYCGLLENVHDRHETFRSMATALADLKTYFPETDTAVA